MSTLQSPNFKNFKERIEQSNQTFMWYPHNRNYKVSEELRDLFVQWHINNIGDPYNNVSTYLNHAREFEQYGLEYRAEKYNLNKDNVGWYINACGTEGNMASIYIAKQQNPNGILYYSEDTHYSGDKISNIMSIEKCIIKSQANGEIDYNHFAQQIEKNVKRPAIINLNIGTTVTGAIDQTDKILDILDSLNKKDHHIHLDCALSWGFLPFLESNTKPDIWFHKDIKSIAISGHKFIGSPIPYGIFLTPKDYSENIGQNISYINSKDTTIMWSRSGLASIFLRDQIEQRGDYGFSQEIKNCRENTIYLSSELNKIGKNTLVNDDSITVVFDEPSRDIVNKFWLACDGKWQVHIVVMQHVTKDMIDLFVQDITNQKVL
jgi:histidine decarboxylase